MKSDVQFKFGDIISVECDSTTESISWSCEASGTWKGSFPACTGMILHSH